MPLPSPDENWDGETWDIAGPSQALTAIPSNERVWIAQGRKRLPLQASDRVRKENEVRDFTAFNGPADLRRERPIAVEYGQSRKRLYTLTDDVVEGVDQPYRWCLYAEDVTIPSNPVQIAVHRFVDICPYPDGMDCDHINSKHWPYWDPIQDIKLWEGTGSQPDLIVARTRKRLVTIELTETSGIWTFQIRGWASELFKEGRGPGISWGDGEQWFHDSAGFIDDYKIAFLIDVTLEEDQNGRMMAYALAECGGYGPSRPYPGVVVACDLNKAGGYLQPTFDADETECVRYVVFNPVAGYLPSDPEVLDPEIKDAHSAFHLDAYHPSEGTGTGTFLYVACGKDQQVQRVNVTNLFPQNSSGTTCQGSIILPPSSGQATKLTIQANQHMRHVVADPDTPETRFMVLEQENTHVWNNDSVVASSTTEPNSLGPNRDAFVMKIPNGANGFTKQLWSVLSNQVDHIGKVYDVSNTVTSLALVSPRGQFYGINSSDGAVAIGNHVYLPTFGGIGRYELVNGSFLYAEDSFRPAEDPLAPGQVGLTEHIDRGLQLPLPSGTSFEDQVFVAPAVGGEFFYRIDGMSRNPSNANWISPDNGIIGAVILAAGGSWNYNCQAINCTNTGVFGNDNVHVDISEYAPLLTNRYLINDMTTGDATPGNGSKFQVVLNIFRWDGSVQPFGAWVHTKSVASPAIPHDNKNVGSTSITIAKHPGSGKLAAFVAHNFGLMVFDMDGLKVNGSSIGTLSYQQNVVTASQVSGVAAVEDHVFFIENGIVFDDTTIKGYAWDPNDVLSPLNTSSANVWTMLLKDALPTSTLPRHPGQARRGRVRNLSGTSGGYPNRHVYFAQDPYLIQWKWPRMVGTVAKPNELDLTGYWRSDYDSFMQDCRIHDFSGLPTSQTLTYVLVARESESFAIVGPID